MHDQSFPQIIPAILATSEPEYLEKIEKVESNNLFDNSWVQIDFMDNKFVHNQSISPQTIKKYPTNLKLEAHLMVVSPDNWIEELIKTSVKRVIFPIEDSSGIEERITHLKNHGIEVGISVNPETSVSKVNPFFDRIDLLLLMSVHPGFGGQPFIPETIGKIEEAADFKKYYNFKTEVDGGINETTIPQVIKAGADYLVIGSYLIDGNIKENYQKIKQQIEKP